MMKDIISYIKGFRCETCTEERVFGSPPNSKPDNLYIYGDLSGATRCFSKKHMSYTNEGKKALLSFEDDWKYVCYGEKLISDVISRLK